MPPIISVPANSIDISLINAFSNGDKDAFATLYHRYQQAVFHNIARLISQEHIGEDILQEVFFRLWENRHKFRSEQEVAAWLFTVSYNQSISYIRKIIREKKYLSFQFSRDRGQQLIAGETGDIREMEELKTGLLEDAISHLSARKKQVFELCKLQGKSYAEAAEIMGIAPDTVKEHMAASLKFIRNYVRTGYASQSMAGLTLLYIYLQA